MAKIICNPLPNGGVEIVGSGVINAQEASLLIVEIANAAKLAHERSGRQLPDRTVTEAPVPYVTPSSIGLSPGPREGFILLSLLFGAVEVGVPIAIDDGRRLGQVLIAASADGSAH
jgi:hypothetical protein